MTTTGKNSAGCSGIKFRKPKRTNQKRNDRFSLSTLEAKIIDLERDLEDARSTNHYQSALQNHEIALITIREDLRVIKQSLGHVVQDIVTIRRQLCTDPKWHKAFHGEMK